MIRRISLLFALGVVLAGCSVTGGNDAAMSAVGKPANAQAATRLQHLLAAGAPVLLVGVETRGQVATLARLVQRGGRATCVTADDVSISFEHGILVATRGVGFDLMSADISGPKRLILARRAGRATRFHSYLDGENHTVIHSYVCDVTNRGARRVAAGKGTIATTLMAETCAGAADRFENLYWLDPRTGTIVQSRQWVGPTTGSLQLRTVSQ